MTRQELAKLSPGDRVRLTDDAVEQGLLGYAISREGVVVRVHVGRADGFLMVRRAGIKTSNMYGRGHWEVVDP